jgi:hypothetical protein
MVGMKFSYTLTKRILYKILLLLLIACSSRIEPEGHPSGLMIYEINPNKWTSLVKQNLLQLSQVYDLSPFLFTKMIQVESKVIPQSHPVFILNTRFAEKPLHLLAMFLNQEFQWWLIQNQEKYQAAFRELKKAVPNAPETNSLGKDSTYIKILAAQLEFLALTHYLGLNESKRIQAEKVSIEKQDPWVYKTVQLREAPIRRILQSHHLLPPPLN